MKNKKITNFWKKNAKSWIQIIDQEAIESRKIATNQAILDVAKSYHFKQVLDAGCGEGWLSRSLHAAGISVTGIDVSAELIANARQKGEGHYEVMGYESLIRGEKLTGQPFDGIIFNFSLFGDEETQNLLSALSPYLQETGKILIQTLHPMNAEGSYRSEWRPGDWTGVPGDFQDPHDWYFRTFGDWIGVLTNNGFTVEQVGEPIHPETGKPLSLILVAGLGKSESLD